MTLRAFLVAVKTHWKTFVATAALVLAVGLTWLVLTPAKYVSTTRLMVSVEGATTAAAYQNDEVVAGRVNTYLALLTSDVVNQRVIDKLKLPESPHELAAEVNATIVPPRTPLIDIAVTDESAERAHLIAQTLAEEFVKFTGAMETPTGEDGQKVHTTIVTAATAPHQQRAERVALGGLAALAALVLGAAAVWIGTARDPVLRIASPDAATTDVRPNKHTAPVPPRTVDVLEGYRRLQARLRTITEGVRTVTRGGQQPGAATADVPPTAPTAPSQPTTVEATAQVPPTDNHDTAAAVLTPTAPTAPAQPTTVEATAQVPPTDNHDTAAAVLTPTAPTAPSQPTTVDVLQVYRRLRARLRSMFDRSRRIVGGHGAVKGGQHAAPSTGRVETLPHTHLEAAKPEERTPWLLAFLCVLIPILPSFVVPAGPLKSNGSPAKLIAVLFFGLAVLGFVLIRRAASTRTVQPGVIIILVYFLLQIAVYGVGLTHSASALVEANRTRVLLNLVANVGVALYVIIRVRTTRHRKMILGCLAIGLAFACLAGLLQSMTHIDLRFFFKPPGFVVNTEDLELQSRSGVQRVVGTSPHPIEFSILAAIAVPLTIFLARNATTWWIRLGAVLACGLALVSMPGSVSRTGVIALAVALFVYMWYFPVRQIARALIVGSTLLVGYVIFAAGIALALWGSITGAKEDDSIQDRIADYAQVSRTFREHPLFGLGLGGSPVTEYGLLDNEWLQSIVQGGLVGLTAMIVLVVGGVFGFAAALRRATTRAERDQAYVLGSMFIAIVVCTFTFDLFSFQQVTRILFIIFGLLWSTFTISLPPDGPGDPRPLPLEHSRPAELRTLATR